MFPVSALKDAAASKAEALLFFLRWQDLEKLASSAAEALTAASAAQRTISKSATVAPATLTARWAALSFGCQTFTV